MDTVALGELFALLAIGLITPGPNALSSTQSSVYREHLWKTNLSSLRFAPRASLGRLLGARASNTGGLRATLT